MEKKKFFKSFFNNYWDNILNRAIKLNRIIVTGNVHIVPRPGPPNGRLHWQSVFFGARFDVNKHNPLTAT